MRIRKNFDLVHVRNYYSNNVVLKRVTIDKDLLNNRALSVDILKFLWSDIFTLRKFEDILSSINDFNRSIRKDYAYIARTHPAILRESFFGPLGVLKIALENIRTSKLDFTPWRIISRKISQFRAISKSDSHRWDHTSNSA